MRTFENYNLKFTTRSCVNCEARLGRNPLNVFMEASENRLPKISDVLVILHECILPLNHGVKLEDVYDAFDAYCEKGNTLVDLMTLMVEVFEDSGFVPKDTKKA